MPSEHTKGVLNIMAYEGGWTGLGIRDKALGDQLLFKLALNNEANAHRLVKCWNCHDDLVAALEKGKKEQGIGDSIMSECICRLLSDETKKNLKKHYPGLRTFVRAAQKSHNKFEVVLCDSGLIDFYTEGFSSFSLEHAIDLHQKLGQLIATAKRKEAL